MFVFSNPDMQQSYLQRSRKSPKSGPMPSPGILPPSASSPVLAPLQQQLSNLGIKCAVLVPPFDHLSRLCIRYISPSISSSAATPHMGGATASGNAGSAAAMQPPPLQLDGDAQPKFIKGTSIMLQPPPLLIREDECGSL
jgi:hypothetical protein